MRRASAWSILGTILIWAGPLTRKAKASISS